MLFALVCIDKPGSLDLRLANREAHLAHIEANKEKVKIGGPFIDEDGVGMTGSLIVLEADSLEDVEAFSKEDPYAKAGLFESVSIRPWKWTVGNPES